MPAGLPSLLRPALHAVIAVVLATASLRAADWPQWRGPSRDGVWRETGTLDAIPVGGLPVRWRVRVGFGYSGPVVSEGRVFVTDRQRGPEQERVLCFEEATGKLLWKHAYPCSYENMEYGNGPRASPTVHAGLVYTLGTQGHLACLRASSGEVVWQHELTKEYDAKAPQYGVSAAPLIEGDVVIVCAGGRPEATVIAFDRNTGDVRWKALDDRPAYSAPIALTAGGRRQAIVWTGDTVSALDPATGAVLWQIPYKATFDPAQAVASPVVHKDLLLCLGAWNRGALMLRLDADKPAASVLWKTRSQPTTTMSTPLFQDDQYFYASLGDGRIACLETATGNEVWGTRVPTSERFGHAHLTPNGDKVWIFNQKGHLVLARLTPAGYQDFGRTLLVEPTAGYRAADPVAWAHPAYANRHVFARNDRELVCVSLAADQAPTAGPSSQVAVNSRELVATGERVESLAQTVAFAPDGQSIAVGTAWGKVRLLDLATGKETAATTPHNDWVCAVAFSPDGKRLVSAGGSEFMPARNGNMTTGEIKLWDVPGKSDLGRLTGHTSKVFAAAFSPDGKTLATGSADQTVRLWDMASQTERAVLKGHSGAVSSVAFASDGRLLVSGGWDRTARLWDPITGEVRGSFTGHEEEILAVAISPDGRTLATGSADWTVRLWNVESKETEAILKGHRGTIYSLVFSSDGKTLLTGSGDETIKLWDVSARSERMTLRGHKSGVIAMALSPDGKTLATAASDDPVRLWDLTQHE